MRAWWLLVVCACNQVLDIKSTRGYQCWSSAETEHDEDGDSFTDTCDNCPGDPNPTQQDSDQDGVGDGCDPHPGEVDRIEHFEAFLTLDDWSVNSGSGTWTSDGEAALQSVDSDFNTLLLDSGAYRYATIEAVLSNIGPGTQVLDMAGIGMQTSNKSLLCANGTVLGANPFLAMAGYTGTNQDASTNTPFAVEDPPLTLVMTTQRGADPVCTARRGELTATVTIASNLDARPAQIEIGTVNTHATFDWLAVYAQP